MGVPPMGVAQEPGIVAMSAKRPLGRVGTSQQERNISASTTLALQRFAAESRPYTRADARASMKPTLIRGCSAGPAGSTREG
jgi:hypothetical protein